MPMSKTIAALAAGVVMTAAAAVPAQSAQKTIAEIVAGDPNFSTLLTVAKAAHFDDELDEVYGLTVFAPTNAAFAKLPPETVQALLDDPEALRAVLLYHILPTTVRANQVPLRPRLAETLNGCERLKVDRTKAGKVFVDGVQVKKANIRAENGYIHVIDAVLIPARGCPGLDG